MSTKGRPRKSAADAAVTAGALEAAAVTRPGDVAGEPVTDAESPALQGSGFGSGVAQSMVIPEGYRQVKALVEGGSPLVFVSGNAGTGKTTLIRYLRDALDRRSVVLAPTGVAALNAGGATIHSFFRFPPRIQDPRDIRIPEARSLYQALELIVIDEVSMLRADVLDCIDHFLRECHGYLRPFGGVQLLLLGDLFQLPPVTSSEEWEILRTRGYRTPYFFSASSLREAPLAHVQLDEVFRQTDVEFITLLNSLRTGEDLDAAVAEINSRCCPAIAGDAAGLHPDGGPEPGRGPDITLTCTNRAADEINAAEMAALHTEESLFVGTVEGRFRIGRDRLPSPLELRLKEGARVMFTRNDDAGRWVNGTLGTVRWISGTRVEVELTDGSVHEVERATWQSYEYRLDRAGDRIVAEEVGSYEQYPVMLAWAVTIHKSQGKTLDNVVVDLGSGAFAPGQAYVALSRCRSLDGIRLVRPLRISDVKRDPRIWRFYQALALAASVGEE